MNNFVYFGTPDFSTLVLDELEDAGFTPSLVVTAPDKPAGRGLILSQSPVKKWASTHNIPILQPERFDEAVVTALAAAHGEFAVVAAYRKILPTHVLALFPKGALNVHPSLLPRYRGTSPVESQILADGTDVGVSVILMDEKMDHGPVVAQEKVSIPGWPVSRNVANKVLWKIGGKLLATILPSWLAGNASVAVQNEDDATITKKTTKDDGLLDLSTSARQNYLKYLAYDGWPGTYFIQNGKRIKVTQASFKKGQFIIERVVPEGKREVSYEDFTR